MSYGAIARHVCGYTLKRRKRVGSCDLVVEDRVLKSHRRITPDLDPSGHQLHVRCPNVRRLISEPFFSASRYLRLVPRLVFPVVLHDNNKQASQGCAERIEHGQNMQTSP